MLKIFLTFMMALLTIIIGVPSALAQNDTSDPVSNLTDNLNHYSDTATVFCWWYGCPLPPAPPDPHCPGCIPGFQLIRHGDDVKIPNEEFGYILPFGFNTGDLVLALYKDSEPTGVSFDFDADGVTISAEKTAQLGAGEYQWRLIEGDKFSPDISLEAISPITGGTAFIVESIPEEFGKFAGAMDSIKTDPASSAAAYGLLSQINAAQWQFDEAYQNATKAYSYALKTDSTEAIYNSWLFTQNFTPPAIRNNITLITPKLFIEDIPADIRNLSAEQQLFGSG